MSKSDYIVMVLGSMPTGVSLYLAQALANEKAFILVDEIVDGTPPEDTGLFGELFDSTPVTLQAYEHPEPQVYCEPRPIQEWQGRGKRKMPRQRK